MHVHSPINISPHKPQQSMKEIVNVPHNSENPTIDTIISLLTMDNHLNLPPLSSSSSSSSSSWVSGGRALDRHNPIITDEKRRELVTPRGTPLVPSLSSLSNTPQKDPTTPDHNDNFKKSRKLLGRKKRNNNIITPRKPSASNSDDDDIQNKLMMNKATCTVTRPASGVAHFSPPESSRYLLDDSSFLEVLSYDENDAGKRAEEVAPMADDPLCPKAADLLSSPVPPTGSSHDQVVVLRVSLHCRGCERKMKKHLSRMTGVTSFNVDYAAKKVTVVGDVTPLQVLASISKVKTAQLWTPTMPSSYPITQKIWKKADDEDD